MKTKIAAMLAGSSLLALASPALAQPDGAENDDEIVVTGSQIRGVEQTGSQILQLDAEAIATVGAFNNSELLSSLPQVGQFNARFEQDPRGAFQDSVNRPNLRNLPGFNAASGSVTLIIADGHRLTPVGVGEAAVDPDIIPSAVLQRIEVVTDGGSSIYGADAVAGVINFMSRRSFDGVQVDANYGFGDTIDGFSQYDVALTAGTNWGSGNGYISVATSDRDSIINGETSWARQGNWLPNGTLDTLSSTICRRPPGSPCNSFNEDAYLAGQERDSFFGALTQELAENVELHVTGYHTARDVNMPLYPAGSTIGGIGFTYDLNSGYVDRDFLQSFETWGITPELTIDLGSDWQLRSSLHYGQSENTSFNPTVNNALATAAVAGLTLDPNNVAAADPALIRSILDSVDAGETVHELLDFRAVADGPLLQLPAGPLRVAVGFESANSSAETRGGGGTYAAFAALPLNSADRVQISVFGEANVPVFEALDLTFSVRHDDYSDFGDTTNPTLGFDLHPLDGLRIFGHWGTSFNAPTVLDSFGPLISQGRLITGLPAFVITGQDALDGDVDWDGVGTEVLQGTGVAGDLEPQTAEQWALGGEFEPTDGLRFGVNYYHIDFDNILGAVDPQNPLNPILFPQKFIWNPTQAQYDAYLTQVNNAAGLPATPANIAFILDRITDNLQSATLTGLDFSASYTRDTSIGTFDIGVSGNYQISFELNNADFLKNNRPDLALVGTLGWRGDHLSTRLTVNYTGSYDTNTTQGRQAEVDSFTTADLFVGYDLGAFGHEESSLRFAVDNVFDEEPPIWRQGQGSGVAWSGYTLGRVFKVGVTARF